MSTLETNLVQPSTGTTLTLGASGDTVTIPSGATIANSGTATGFGLTAWSESGGSLVASNAAYGIYLGVATATAANLLDDYEEGTWTPVPKAGATDISGSGDCYGSYRKVGSIVYCTCRLSVNRGSNTGTFTVTGLPFAPNESNTQNNNVINANPHDGVIIHNNGGNFPWIWANNSTIYGYDTVATLGDALGNVTAQTMFQASTQRYLWLGGTYKSN